MSRRHERGTATVPPRDEQAGSPPLDFDAWVREHYAALVRWFSWVTAMGLEPHDVVQEALLVANARLRKGSVPDNLIAFVHVVGARIANSEAAGRRPFSRWRRHEMSVPDFADTGRLVSAMSAANLDPEDRVVWSGALAAAFEGLNHRERHVLLLKAEGLGDAAIATMLGLKSGNHVAQIRLRARAKAKVAFAEYEAPAPPNSPNPTSPMLVWAAGVSRRINSLPVGWLTEPAAACVALTAALSVVITLASPSPGVASASDGRGASRIESGAVTPDPDSMRAVARQARSSSPRPTPPAEVGSAGTGPDAPTAPAPAEGAVCTDADGVATVCLRTAPPEDKDDAPSWDGDRLSITALGENSPVVEQDVAPTCDRLQGQPVVTCEQGRPDYRVKELPSALASAGADKGGTTP